MNRTVSISLDDDDFFDSCDRMSSVVALDLASLDDEDDEFYEASRMSFARGASIKRIYSIAPVRPDPSSAIPPAYDMWIAEPGDLKERRQRLLQGMGLVSNKDLLRLATSKVVRTVSIKPNTAQLSPSPSPAAEPANSDQPPQNGADTKPVAKAIAVQLPVRAIVLIRSRSDADIDMFSTKTKQRKLDLLGPVSKNKIIRTMSGQLVPSTSSAIKVVKEEKTERHHRSRSDNVSVVQDAALGSFVLIKNLDTGNDFIVKEFNDEGWNKLNDLHTGKQLTMDEFEMSVGHSPVVKELMRRASKKQQKKDSHFTKSFRSSTRKGSAILRNLKGAASGFLVVEKMEKAVAEKAEKEEKESIPAEQKVEKQSPQWVDAHQHGKTLKEFTALHFSQEIQAHEGSIWTMRFSSDSRLLASAGEDTHVHVWQVRECEIAQPKPPREAESTSHHAPADDQPSTDGDGDDGDASNRLVLAEMAALKKGKKTGKGVAATAIPDHVKLPETVVALSKKPKYTLKGHKDEVLDLAWSHSQQLISSSMDKTVRMWELETQSCLKIFAHSDYVTCIQFNPVVDNHFISGSLDGKLRIWSVPDRQVVDWTDVHEMLTAAAYTPDGQGAIVGSQQGNCKIYSAQDSTLEHRMDIQKKKKSQTKKFSAFQSPSKKLPGFQTPAPAGKITGFQFTPWSPSEVLITSADSRIGIYNGPDIIQKIRGFRNTSSQMSASFCPDGKHIISASEDSQVYIWKVEEMKSQGAAKKKIVGEVNAHENFACKDVSVAITWPGSRKYEAPAVDLHPKKTATSVKRPAAPTQEEDASGCGSTLPPLPKKKKDSEEKKEDQAEPAQEETSEAAAEAAESTTTTIMQATTWGLVIVTATLEGEIKVYQNFGLPVKAGRQTLF
ncbi:WD repeat-containing protein 44-like isoform X2 [Salvia divinorum]|uniref:WD repeat-containing protein 44-like isoform X2 n=1 Tax=Salvia divinorum TaxID=28513 RepID=A0ABD1GPJ7_SALDI